MPEAINDAFDSGELFLVNPSVPVLDAVAEAAYPERGTRIRVLGVTSILKGSAARFTVSTKAAELVDQDYLVLRSTVNLPRNSLLIGDGQVTVLLTDTRRHFAVVERTAELAATLDDGYADRWDGANGFSLRTPQLSRIRDSIETEFGAEFLSDFDTVFAALESGNQGGLNGVIISLLLAARNEELLYDISRWGEDIGMGSKAKFSRTKTDLDDQGMIKTEKAPIDVGRPRQRLLLADDALHVQDAGKMIAEARRQIST